MNLAPETRTKPSIPQELTKLGDRIVFTATEGVHGQEVWTSDGTEAGTRLVLDIVPGTESSFPYSLFVGNGTLYFFTEETPHVHGLWRSDGTAGGTTRLATVGSHRIESTTARCFGKGVAVGDAVYFAAVAAGRNELWRTDGTAVGTRRVAGIQFNDQPCELTAVGNRLYFAASAGGQGSELWTTDGSEAGTVQVADIYPFSIGSNPNSLVNLDGVLYFIATDDAQGQQMWTTDGTASGTRVAVRFSDGQPLTLRPLGNGKMIAAIRDNYANVYTRLWSTDGKTATRLSDSANVYNLTMSLGGTPFYFSARSTTMPNFMVPWVTDGTPAGTRSVLPVTASYIEPEYPHNFVDFDGIVFFEAVSEEHAFWRTNGTAAGTRLVAKTDPTFRRVVTNHRLIFTRTSDEYGEELFAIDNDRPIAIGDSLGSIPAGGSVTLDLVANDTDADGSVNVASVVIATQPLGGTVSVNTSGTAIYTARTGFSGSDSFTYTVADDQGFVSAPAEVKVDVTAPSGNGGSGGTDTSPTPPPNKGKGGGGSLLVLDLAPLLLLYLRRRWHRSKRQT